jgi:hypothetical protein
MKRVFTYKDIKVGKPTAEGFFFAVIDEDMAHGKYTKN